MVVTCVYVHVKPETVTDFIEATRINQQGTRKESGNLRFDLLQEPDDQTRFLIYEVFESREAVEEHKTREHYLKWRDTVAVMMAEPRKGVRYTAIEPVEKTEW
ncbi:MAG: antibiotic biosynthesis monooxygenase [Bacteroidales bacterium]